MHNTEVDKSPKLTILRSAKNRLEDLLLPKFVENANTHTEETLHDKIAHERAQDKSRKTNQRFNEHVKKSKPIRNMNNVKKQYLSGDKQVNRKIYFCLHKNDYVRWNFSLLENFSITTILRRSVKSNVWSTVMKFNFLPFASVAANTSLTFTCEKVAVRYSWAERIVYLPQGGV